MAERINVHSKELREMVYGPGDKGMYQEALAGYRAATGAAEFLRDFQPVDGSDYQAAILLSRPEALPRAEDKRGSYQQLVVFIGRLAGLSETEIGTSIEPQNSK